MVVLFVVAGGCFSDPAGSASATSTGSGGTTAEVPSSSTGTRTGGPISTTIDTGSSGSTGSGSSSGTGSGTATSRGSETGQGVWADSRLLNVSASVLDLAGPVTDVPVLVRLNGTRIDYDAAASEGTDVRFLDDVSGEQLSHEIDLWNPAGNSVVWLKLPVLPQAEVVVVRMEFGNPEASDQQDVAAVWSNGYEGVWHMSGPCELEDSTGNGYDGMCEGIEPQAFVPATLGQGLRFSADSQRVVVVPRNALELTAALTMEGWALVTQKEFETGPPRQRRIIERTGGYTLATSRLSTPFGPTARATYASTQASALTQDPPLPGYHFYAGTAAQDGGPNAVQLYLDGVLSASGSAAQPDLLQPSDTALTQLGGNIVGLLDEVRLSSVERDTDWIAVQAASVEDMLIQYE